MALALAGAALVPATMAGQAVYTSETPKEPGARSWLARKAALPPFEAPRLPDGTPDLQGRWGGSYSGDDIEETERIDATTPPAESRVSDPPDGRVPYQPWALAERNRYRANLARDWPGETGQRLYMDPQTFCLKNVPRYAQRGFELVQTPGYVVQMLNWGHYHRRIPLDGRSRPAASAKFWMGIARGRWDGDTLVVDSTNLNGKMWLDSVGNFFSDLARVVERFRLADINTLDYEVTIEDPATFTRPWKINAPLRRAGSGGCAECGVANQRDADPYAAESWEHACHEGNGPHVDGARTLGFKWYPGAKPPAR
ncbi:MAG: hypothetical protein A3I61_19550 [Acidobacteria bacterium RIFCSPLOWO2_02_FULL_68_18]|nr:MAG: hypothetical protein A3I61_19550 [Acidobacteria bacterium RIFCSPLOWO2_02_FULL_68_18]OFW49033.1 MAG: hypothetical protein A3G77_11605 [Acidobacteria bacterium RIFCSPLOWO2_12_FULL_68_19]